MRVYYSDRWGNICHDDYYSSHDAVVICHQLGYTGASSFSRSELTKYNSFFDYIILIFLFSYGTDYYPTIIDDVICHQNNYLAITQCNFNTIIDDHNCKHNPNSYDATVYCCKLNCIIYKCDVTICH